MNLASSYPYVVDKLIGRIEFYHKRSVEPRRTLDKNAAKTARANGAWGPWLPDLMQK